MKHLIHKYLDRYYYIKGKSIYNSDGSEEYLYYFKTSLEKIFDLPRDKLKWYVKSWCRKQNKGFDFKNFWNPNRFVIYSMPIRANSMIPNVTWNVEFTDNYAYQAINTEAELIETLNLQIP